MKNKIFYQRFGSDDSQDIDCLVFINQIPETKIACNELCKIFDYELSKLFPDEKINCNLGIVSNGILTQVYKGATDETNNAMLTTYHLHQQYFENQILHKVERNIELKIHRATRIILSYLSKSNERVLIKSALNGTIYSKIKVLKELNLSEIVFSSKEKNLKEDIYKVITFQMAQTLALLEGKEIYTKKEAISLYPDLATYLLRNQNSSLHLLENFFVQFSNNILLLHPIFSFQTETELLKIYQNDYPNKIRK
jgi:hypothetical protein